MKRYIMHGVLLGLVVFGVFILGMVAYAAEPDAEHQADEPAATVEAEPELESAETSEVPEPSEDAETVEIVVPESFDELFESMSGEDGEASDAGVFEERSAYSSEDETEETPEETQEEINAIERQEFLIIGVVMIVGSVFGLAFMTKWNVGV